MGNLSSKSAGNVVFGLTYPWGGEEDSCLAKFYQLSHIEKSRIIRRARRLLHVVGDNHYVSERPCRLAAAHPPDRFPARKGPGHQAEPCRPPWLRVSPHASGSDSG